MKIDIIGLKITIKLKKFRIKTTQNKKSHLEAETKIEKTKTTKKPNATKKLLFNYVLLQNQEKPLGKRRESHPFQRKSISWHRRVFGRDSKRNLSFHHDVVARRVGSIESV